MQEEEDAPQVDIRAVKDDTVVSLIPRPLGEQTCEEAGVRQLAYKFHCRLHLPLPDHLVIFGLPPKKTNHQQPQYSADEQAQPLTRLQLHASLLISSDAPPVDLGTLDHALPFSTILNFGDLLKERAQDIEKRRDMGLSCKLQLGGSIFVPEKPEHQQQASQPASPASLPLTQAVATPVCTPPDHKYTMMPAVTETPPAKQQASEEYDATASSSTSERQRAKKQMGRKRRAAQRSAEAMRESDPTTDPSEHRAGCDARAVTRAARGRAKQVQAKETDKSEEGKNTEEMQQKRQKDSHAAVRSTKRAKRGAAGSKGDDDAIEGERPSPRWGHTMCSAGDTAVFLYGGQGYDQLCKDAFWMFDGERWSVPEVDGALPGARMGHSCVYDPEGERVILYGGAKYRRFFKDVQCFDLKTKEWSCLKVQGGKAPALSYHSCVLFHNQLMIFGGNYPNPDPIPDGCSAQLYCFDLEKRLWCKPVLVGDIPPARSGHSATVVDGTLIIFGGWDAPECYNDIYQLDLTLMEFKRLEIDGTPPPPRTWHIAFHTMFKSHDAVFIHGGYNGDEALNDAYVLDLVAREWIKISDNFMSSACAGHAVTRMDEDVIVFGGGDNEGRFFNSQIRWQAS